jgi:hypothetical protein
VATLSPMSRIGRWREALSPRLRRRRAALSRLSTEALAGLLDDPARLRAHFADPTTHDLGLAIEELARRGIDVRPSAETLLEMLTSADHRQCRRGMFLFHAAYPACGGPAPGEGWSSDDPPEAWRVRVARIPRCSRG